MIIDFDKKPLSAQEILDRVNDKDIYEFYLERSINENKATTCCFHQDRSPSLRFYRSRFNNLNFKCFGCGKQGGIFNFVQDLYNLSFGETLRLVAKDFNLDNSPNVILTEKKSIPVKELVETQIIPSYQSFNKLDYNYWNQYYISLDLAYDYGIRSCSKIEIINKDNQYMLWGQYYKFNPMYCYIIDDHFKGYRPLNPNKEGKWISNTKSDDIQGLKQLKSTENLILTSSLKDVIVLKLLGYNAIALSSEAQHTNLEDICYIFYDNDEPGINYAKKLSYKRDIPYIHIPLEHKEKDISDFVKSYNLEEGKELMNKLI